MNQHAVKATDIPCPNSWVMGDWKKLTVDEMILTWREIHANSRARESNQSVSTEKNSGSNSNISG